MFKNYLIGLEKYNPTYFLYENNKSMAPAIREQITKELGVEPILINSALVSAQNRQRLYWTNIPGVTQPEDRGILLRDVLESGVCWHEKAYTLRASADTKQGPSNIIRHIESRGQFGYQGVAEPVNMTASVATYELTSVAKGGPDENTKRVAYTDESHSQGYRVYSPDHKSVALRAQGNGRGAELVAEPIRIGTIEIEAKNTDFDSQQYRAYSPDGKSVTLCGNGGGVGAKTGLYAVPTDCDVVETPAVLRYERTEQAKQLRKAYESGETKHGYHEFHELHPRTDGKSNTVTTVLKDNMVIESWDGKTYPVYEVRNGLITIKDKQYPIKLADGYYIIRKPTVTECKRLQTVPDSYIFPVSNSQAYKMLGNGWTVDVIAHILSHAPGITTEPAEVLSMYDGMSCGHIALDKLGANVVRYYATEIDKYAIQTTMANYPDTVHLGDAFQVREEGWRPNHE